MLGDHASYVQGELQQDPLRREVYLVDSIEDLCYRITLCESKDWDANGRLPTCHMRRHVERLEAD